MIFEPTFVGMERATYRTLGHCCAVVRTGMVYEYMPIGSNDVLIFRTLEDCLDYINYDVTLFYLKD